MTTPFVTAGSFKTKLERAEGLTRRATEAAQAWKSIADKRNDMLTSVLKTLATTAEGMRHIAAVAQGPAPPLDVEDLLDLTPEDMAEGIGEAEAFRGWAVTVAKEVCGMHAATREYLSTATSDTLAAEIAALAPPVSLAQRTQGLSLEEMGHHPHQPGEEENLPAQAVPPSPPVTVSAVSPRGPKEHVHKHPHKGKK